MTHQKQVSDYLENPHQAVELERAVIGAVMVEQRVIAEVMQVLTADSFYDRTNAVLFENITQMWLSGQKVDLLTISQELTKKGLIKQIGGMATLARLTQVVGSGVNTISHARIVAQKYFARSFVDLGMRITAIASDPAIDTMEMITKCNDLADKTNAICVGKSTARYIGVIADDALKQAEKRQERFAGGLTNGIPTGSVALDNILCGWLEGLYILAARPSMGKTAVMIYFAKIAAQYGRNVCIYSLEMSDISLVNRFLLSIADVRADDFRMGRLTSDDWKKLEQARAELNRFNIYIDDNQMVTMDYIASHSQSMKNQGKCDMILVDYLQFMDSPQTTKFGSRNDEVGKMSKKAKQVSKTLGVPFILLSQLSRECEKRTDKRPMMSDLRDSGNIEQDADCVIFLYRPAYYKIETVETSYGPENTKGLLELIIAKQRDGATGSVPMWHNYSMCRFGDWVHNFKNVTEPKIKDDLPF